MKRSPKALIALVVLSGAWCASVAAEGLSPVLPKAEVLPIVTDKKVAYIRKRDNARQSYVFKSPDDVFFATSTTTRNISVSGTYTIADDGGVCFVWHHDKYIPMTDGCVYFRRDGDKLVMVGKREPDLVFGEVVPD